MMAIGRWVFLLCLRNFGNGGNLVGIMEFNEREMMEGIKKGTFQKLNI